MKIISCSWNAINYFFPNTYLSHHENPTEMKNWYIFWVYGFRQFFPNCIATVSNIFLFFLLSINNLFLSFFAMAFKISSHYWSCKFVPNIFWLKWPNYPFWVVYTNYFASLSFVQHGTHIALVYYFFNSVNIFSAFFHFFLLNSVGSTLLNMFYFLDPPLDLDFW